MNRKHGKLGIFLLVVPRSYTFDEGEELQFMGEGERELSKEYVTTGFNSAHMPY